MKTALLITALLAGTAQGDIVFEMTGFKNEAGSVRCALFDSKESWLGEATDSRVVPIELVCLVQPPQASEADKVKQVTVVPLQAPGSMNRRLAPFKNL